ncbi:hypothetical protein [Pseudomonas boreofloridensis]|uniref:hypothetical protein n=1 Tax=Pseudomonas boreofloridensis TaxID=3064348 RepID=UPI003F7A1285
MGLDAFTPLLNYLLALFPILGVFAVWYRITPASQLGLRVAVVVIAFIFTRDMMTPHALWSIGSKPALQFHANPWVLALLGVASILLIACLARLAPALWRLVTGFKGNRACGAAVGVAAGCAIGLPLRIYQGIEAPPILWLLGFMLFAFAGNALEEVLFRGVLQGLFGDADISATRRTLQCSRLQRMPCLSGFHAHSSGMANYPFHLGRRTGLRTSPTVVGNSSCRTRTRDGHRITRRADGVRGCEMERGRPYVEGRRTSRVCRCRGYRGRETAELDARRIDASLLKYAQRYLSKLPVSPTRFSSYVDASDGRRNPWRTSMNKPISSILLAGLMMHLPSLYAAPIDASVASVKTGIAPCYKKDKGVNCEVSAVARVGDQLIFANDKQMPKSGDPAIFTIPIDSKNTLTGAPVYLSGKVINEADKYEGLSTTLDGKYVVAITAFNKEGTAENPAADVLNTLLYWPVGSPQDAKIINGSTRGQVASSRALRERISKAIQAPYYQIEALTTAPGERLLAGIRKYGENSKSADFSFLLLSIPFKINEQGAVLGTEFEVIWKLTPDELTKKLGASYGPRPELGLSGIEFDRYNKDRFYAITSFETDNALGGYLWVLPFDGKTLGEPQPVRMKDGTPLAFDNKPEGVEVLDEHHVLVVHDDDRVRVKDPETGVQRQAHEFVYNVVSFSAP